VQLARRRESLYGFSPAEAGILETVQPATVADVLLKAS
jgi:hypothetical protein